MFDGLMYKITDRLPKILINGYQIKCVLCMDFDTNMKITNVTFNNKVINDNIKRVRFIRKVANIIIRKSSKDLNCSQLRNLLNRNLKKMKNKIDMFVNTRNTRKRRNSIGLLDTTNDLEAIKFQDSELDKKSQQALQKIAKIRQLPDYKRIEKLLNINDELNKKRKRSLNSIVLQKSPTPFWNSHVYLLKEIEKCVAKQCWNKLTTLLICLSSAVKKCEPLLLKASVINFISNPTSQIHELLEGFLKECYSCQTEEDVDQLLTQLFHITPKINTLI